MTEAPQPPQPTTWDDLKALLHWFAATFGDPKQLVEDQVAERPLGLLIRGWLCALETIARALLMMTAAALPKPEAASPRPEKARRAPRAPRPPTDDLVFGEVSDSDGWTDVRFRLLPSEGTTRGRSDRSRPPRRFLFTKSLAFRLEALIRVAENPERLARRLARRLHAEPKLAWRLLRESAPPGCASFPHREVGRARGFAWTVHGAFQPDTG